MHAKRTGWTAILMLALAGCGGDGSRSDGGVDAGVDAGPDAGGDAGVETALVTGRVLDSAGVEVEGATVVFHSDPVEAVTAEDGTFEAEVEPGEHELAISRDGITFHQSTLVIPDATRVDLGDLLPTDAWYQQRLTVRDRGYREDRFDQYFSWCAVSVADADGRPITGLAPEDFQLREAIVDAADGTVAAEAAIPLTDQIADELNDAGVYERTVTGQKLDVVFIMDGTSSMDAEAIREQVHGFVDRMAAEHVDFRVAALEVEETPNLRTTRLFGPAEIDRAHQAIDDALVAAGEWWSPSCTYEALLFVPWLGLRPDARRVVVILTDIVPQTVYGTFWYSAGSGSSSATRSAAEVFLEQQDIELYLSINPEVHNDLHTYVDDGINPRAGDRGAPGYGIEPSGFKSLRWGDGRSPVDLGWPFDAGSLWQALQVPADALRDSVYYLVWTTTLERGDVEGLSDHPEDFAMRMEIEAVDPEAPEVFAAGSYTVPLDLEKTTLSILAFDEEGGPPPDVWAYGYLSLGGRLTQRFYQLRLDQDPVVELVPGTYTLMAGHDHRIQTWEFAEIDVVARRTVVLPPEGLELELELRTAQHAMEMAKARGMLRDLDDWRLSGDPLRKFTDDARGWLDELEADGLRPWEMVALKRFNVALSGYANLTEYAQFESQRAVEDFHDMILGIGRVIDEIVALEDGIQLDWKQALVAGALKALYAVLSQGRINALLDTMEQLLNDLITYASSEVFDELIGVITDHLESLGGPAAVSADFVTIGVELMRDMEGDDWEANRDKLWEAAARLGLQSALHAARWASEEWVFEEAFDDLAFEDELTHAMWELLEEIVEAAWSPDGFDDFDARLESWARNVGSYLWNHNREEIATAADEVFDRLDRALEGRVPARVRDFIVGFMRDLALSNIPHMRQGAVVYDFDANEVIALLVKHAVYNIVLRDFYVDEIQRGLSGALAMARRAVAATPDDDSFYHWKLDMNGDFADYRAEVGSLQDVAWEALSEHEAVEHWAESMIALRQILTPLSETVDVVATAYPPLEPTAENLHSFLAVLNTLEVVTDAVEFGLKVKSLETFGDHAETLYRQAYAH